MSKNLKIVGLAHSKLRNAIGAVGIEVDVDKKEIHVVLVRHWNRSQINEIHTDLADLFNKVEWDNTIIDMQVGEHIITAIRRTADLPIRVINMAKKVKDAQEIERVKTLDLIEMVQYTLGLKLQHRIKFPTKPSERMSELESQIALYSEHASEAGAIDYYAPGDELDNLTKALIAAIFGGRPYIGDDVDVICGPIVPKSTYPTLEEAMNFEMAHG